ncbi:Glucose 1-dehydrogenase [bacterium HR32]|nr:Glucose 1-dehydrogenase [bacterium HR32]
MAFARRGASVGVHYRTNAEGAERVAARVREAGGRAVVLQADLRSPAACEQLVGQAVRSLGRLDVLVNNAGLVDRTGLWEITEALWDEQMAVHVRAPFFLTRAAAAVLPEGGAVVNVASMRGLVAGPHAPHYAVSKAAVLMVTRCLAHAMAPRIRVNAVAPGYTDTRVQAHRPPEDRRRIEAEIPLGRFATSEEVAEAVVYLASDRARYVTGQTLVVAGGLAL